MIKAYIPTWEKEEQRAEAEDALKFYMRKEEYIGHLRGACILAVIEGSKASLDRAAVLIQKLTAESQK